MHRAHRPVWSQSSTERRIRPRERRALVGGDKVGAPFPQIFFSTFPQYGVAFYMALATVLKLGFGICLNSLVKYPLYGDPSPRPVPIRHLPQLPFRVPALRRALVSPRPRRIPSHPVRARSPIPDPADR